MYETGRLRDLGRLIRARRSALGLDMAPTARSISMSPDTWAKVEEGASVRASTYGRMERVLGWPPGSVLAYLDGGAEPVPLPDDRVPDAYRDVTVRVYSEAEERALATFERALAEARAANPPPEPGASPRARRGA